MIDFPFDFPMSQPSVNTAVYCIIMYSICFLYSYNLSNSWDVTRIQKVSSKSANLFAFFIGLFFITNCMNGDFFHALEKVHEFKESDFYYYNGEPIYRALTIFVNNNYLLFRTIVWGGAFAIFCMTAKRMEIPLVLAVSIICVSYSITFCYGRVTAAMAMYFLGLSFFCNPYKHKWFGFVLGLLLVYSSWSFHSSALIMIVMTVMLFMPVKKWTVVSVLMAIPLLAIYMKDYFFLFAFDEDTDEFMANKLLSYSEREVISGIARQIINSLTYTAIYLPLFFCSKLIMNKKSETKTDSSELRLFKVTFGLAYVATAFLFFGDTFYTFFYRILNMTMIPIILLVSKLYVERKMSHKMFLCCILPGIICQIVRYSYMIYLNL